MSKYQSPEWRLNISKSKKGKIPYKWTTAQRLRRSLTMLGHSWNKGYKRPETTEETRQKISLSMSGDKNPAWKGGLVKINTKLRKNFRYTAWRKAVWKRDQGICSKCERIGSDVDHLRSFSKYPKLRYQMSNGRVLCRSCHIKRTALQHKRGSLRSGVAEKVNATQNCD